MKTSMKTNNLVKVTGNLGSDPEMINFMDAKLLRFSVAIAGKRNKRSNAGNTAQWQHITAWGKLADRLQAELQKGSFVSVEGKLQTREYFQRDGQRKFFTGIRASKVNLLRA